ncbi:tRNA lysidine(34) synthetase TilS [Marinicauda algicola]|uniref:tRNA lysidine(34) synthetase TilS n=1 Tax=Marinicauda algicola TaxID=2029849 RepID=UPI0013052588|nr:tRNA lysidine(34) synthetase TilS [Marinicauda algicola]
MLALSGGGDSTALLHILADLARAEARPLHALVVDHRLRADSAAEAETAAHAARSLGAAARVLAWTDPHATQAQARLARHRLLAEAARGTGARTLFLGHTREDRIETLAMRLARAGGGRGLAAMGELDPSPVWPQGRGLRLARPLLHTTREDLRDFLEARGADWVEDPSNADPRYERVRLRTSGLGEDPRFATRLLRLGDAARGFESRVIEAAAGLLDRAASRLAWGGLALDADAWAASAPVVQSRAMEFALLSVSGAPGLPGPGRVEAALAALARSQRRTVAGVLIDEGGRLGRDPAAAGRADGTPGAAPLVLAPGEAGVFDGRLDAAAQDGLVVAVAGSRPADGLEAVPAAFRPGVPVIETASGERLAAFAPGAARYGTFTLLTGARLLHLAFPFGAGTWFDEV